MNATGKVALSELRSFCEEALQRLGVSAGNAAVVADNLLDANLRGIDTHGIARLPNYAARIRSGGIDPKGEVTIVSDRPSVIVLDGNQGPGQVAAARGMRMAIERARERGIASAAVRNSNHLGTLSYFALMALPEEMIGFAVSGAGPGLAPWGGAEPLLGSNPWSVAIPAGKHPPIVVDMANGVVISGKIRAAADRGEPIPGGWALDSAGRPTTDAKAAVAGSVFPFGGAKGSALTLMLEVMASVLTGAAYSTGVGDLSELARPQRVGHLFMALRIDHYLPPDEFRSRADDLLDKLVSSRLAEGHSEIRIPGARGARMQEERTAEGIPIPAGVRDQLNKLAAELGMERSI
jgi:LDH2 family malate/lactate/ureidoglycolate dehydrogenase